MVPERAFAICFLFAVMLALQPFSFAANVRHYYIAAEDVTWDYAPSGRDLVHGRVIPLPWRQQTRWNKTRYIEYTDDSFSVRKPQPEWLGILGPVIRAEVGDTVVVHFLNRSQQPHSIHPHGLRYDKDNEGAHYNPAGHGAMVAPGGSYTYHWLADPGSGPGPDDPSSRVWWYHSHVEAEREINAGLMGPIIVTAAGKANADGAPTDVDREFITMYMIFDEQHGADAGLFHSINGYVFGNLPGLVMKQGEHVRWYLLGMGSEKDMHSPHWHGKTVEYGKRYTDVVELLPASMVTVNMNADNPGTWLLHCHVLDHMEAGMTATYTIYSEPRSCPIELIPGEWQQMRDASAVTIRNTGSKTIRRVTLLSGYIVSAQHLQPLLVAWFSPGPAPPGQVQTITVGKELFHGESGLGVAFFPSSVIYQDGTEWKPDQLGECFRVYWRNKDHPQLPVLPPIQLTHTED
jgi:hypothetical protein